MVVACAASPSAPGEPAACHHAAMSTGDYMRPESHQPCWYCVHWAGPCWGDPYMADCRFGGGKNCKPDAERGCVHWMRQTGVDDDGWSPAPLVRPQTPERKPRAMSAGLYAVCQQIQADLDARQAASRAAHQTLSSASAWGTLTG